jgi:membrane-bound serine protease (ClpP class)
MKCGYYPSFPGGAIMNWTLKTSLVFLVLFFMPFQAFSEGRIVVVEISGAINPVVAEFVTEEIKEANQAKEELIVIRMDTPGGLDTSMRQIIKGILSSTVPVATFVGPSGSRAASAGTFITIASHIAAMAPGTNIGAAHPVNLMGGGGEQSSTMEQKVVQDASAYIRSLAEKRGRNAQWAELAVAKSVSISAGEAIKLNVIDLIAANVEALVLALDGRKIEVDSTSVTLKTADREIVYRAMSKRQRILDTISNPNVAYILMMLGLVGLYFELSNPGLILPGVIGGISMILALYAMQTLPINYAGLMLIVLGLILFIVELNVMSFGLLSAGGVIAILLGSLMLIDSDDPAMQISNTVLVPTIGVFVTISLGILYLAVKSQKHRAISGMEGLIGAEGVVKAALNPVGSVLIHGEIWNAEGDGNISAGEKVIVNAVEGLKLKVKSADK